MSAESQLLVGLWEAVRDVVPAAKRADAAEGIIRAMVDYGMDRSDLAAAEDEDRDLGEAIRSVFADDDETEGDDEE